LQTVQLADTGPPDGKVAQPSWIDRRLPADALKTWLVERTPVEGRPPGAIEFPDRYRPVARIHPQPPTYGLLLTIVPEPLPFGQQDFPDRFPPVRARTDVFTIHAQEQLSDVFLPTGQLEAPDRLPRPRPPHVGEAISTLLTTLLALEAAVGEQQYPDRFPPVRARADIFTIREREQLDDEFLPDGVQEFIDRYRAVARIHPQPVTYGLLLTLVPEPLPFGRQEFPARFPPVRARTDVFNIGEQEQLADTNLPDGNLLWPDRVPGARWRPQPQVDPTFEPIKASLEVPPEGAQLWPDTLERLPLPPSVRTFALKEQLADTALPVGVQEFIDRFLRVPQPPQDWNWSALELLILEAPSGRQLFPDTLERLPLPPSVRTFALKEQLADTNLPDGNLLWPDRVPGARWRPQPQIDPDYAPIKAALEVPPEGKTYQPERIPAPRRLVDYTWLQSLVGLTLLGQDVLPFRLDISRPALRGERQQPFVIQDSLPITELPVGVQVLSDSLRRTDSSGVNRTWLQWASPEGLPPGVALYPASVRRAQRRTEDITLSLLTTTLSVATPAGAQLLPVRLEQVQRLDITYSVTVKEQLADTALPVGVQSQPSYLRRRLRPISLLTTTENEALRLPPFAVYPFLVFAQAAYEPVILSRGANETTQGGHRAAYDPTQRARGAG
jgi:hypothetical protein